MAKADAIQEPSMEEILASIRRIIADEEPGADAGAAARHDAAPPPQRHEDELDVRFAQAAAEPRIVDPDPDEPVLELTEELEDVADPEMVEFDEDAGENDVVFADDADMTDEDEPAEDEPTERVEIDPPTVLAAPRGEEGGDSLLSSAASSSIHDAFNTLAHTIMSSNSRTLEDLVKEMLRPMLKGWLEENLPAIVERLVRQEIERVSRGR